jgi:hypothetical protein
MRLDCPQASGKHSDQFSEQSCSRETNICTKTPEVLVTFGMFVRTASLLVYRKLQWVSRRKLTSKATGRNQETHECHSGLDQSEGNIHGVPRVYLISRYSSLETCVFQVHIPMSTDSSSRISGDPRSVWRDASAQGICISSRGGG